jgi:hypothetical protein
VDRRQVAVGEDVKAWDGHILLGGSPENARDSSAEEESTGSITSMRSDIYDMAEGQGFEPWRAFQPRRFSIRL